VPAERTQVCHSIYTDDVTHRTLGDIRNYIIVHLFNTRVVQLVKLTKCWNNVVFRGLTIDEKFGLFEAIWKL